MIGAFPDQTDDVLARATLDETQRPPRSPGHHDHPRDRPIGFS